MAAAGCWREPSDLTPVGCSGKAAAWVYLPASNGDMVRGSEDNEKKCCLEKNGRLPSLG